MDCRTDQDGKEKITMKKDERRENTHPNAESWLAAATDGLRPYFEKLGHPLPEKIRAAIDSPLTGQARGASPVNAGIRAGRQTGITKSTFAPIRTIRLRYSASLSKNLFIHSCHPKPSTAIPGITGASSPPRPSLAAIGGGRQFKSGREFAAWVGLVPRQSSSGGKERLGRISKKGNAYLRRLLVMGATAQLRGARQIGNAPGGPWFGQLIRRKSARVASVALANKMARVAWAVLTKGEVYRCATT